MRRSIETPLQERLVRRSEDEDLLEGGHAVADTVERGHAEGAHALADGDLAHFAGVGAGNDELADFVADGHGFDDGKTAGVTGTLATFAAATAVKGVALEEARVDVEVRIHLVVVGDGLFAMRADAAHEALRAGQDDGRGNQERRDAHVVQTRDGAGSVITMHGAQHLVTGERGFDRDFGGFGIGDFADHDDVRVLAQNGAQGVGEGEADLFFHGHLVDAGHLEFDRVFDGDDVVNGAVKLVECGVKRGGLAGTGGAGDENQTVRRIHRTSELLESVGIEAEFVEAGGEVRLVEHAEHDFFTVDRGQKGDAQIEVLAADANAHTTVLREAAFGDVEAAHDLNTRGERQLHLLGRRSDVDERAVNAITETDHLFKRLDVNIAGAVLDGLDENEVGQFDDGGFFAGGGELVEVDLLHRFFGDFEIVGIGIIVRPFLAFVDDVFHAAAFGGVDGLELVENGALGGDERKDFKFGDALDVVDGENVERVGHGQEQFIVQAGDGNDLVIVGDVARQNFRDFRRD